MRRRARDRTRGASLANARRPERHWRSARECGEDSPDLAAASKTGRAGGHTWRGADLLLLLKDEFSVEALGGPKQTVHLDVTVTELPAAVIEAELVVAVSYVICAAGDRAAYAKAKVHARVPVRLRAEGGQDRLSLNLPRSPMS